MEVNFINKLGPILTVFSNNAAVETTSIRIYDSVAGVLSGSLFGR